MSECERTRIGQKRLQRGGYQTSGTFYKFGGGVDADGCDWIFMLLSEHCCVFGSQKTKGRVFLWKEETLRSIVSCAPYTVLSYIF